MVPTRYLPKDPSSLNASANATVQWLDLPDSGVPESLMRFGSPAQGLFMLIDSVESNTLIPSEFVEQYQSTTLQFTSEGAWQDIFQVGELKVEQVFHFSGDEGILGLSVVEGDEQPFVDNVIARRLLGMSLVSLHLRRASNGHLSGELLVGQIPQHPRNALLRYSPVAPGEDSLGGSWRLKINDLRVDGEALNTKGLAIIDTTTPFVILPVKVFRDIIKQLQVPIRESQGILISRPQACSVLRELPPIYLSIETDEFLWDAAHYIIPADDYGQCLLAMVGFDGERRRTGEGEGEREEGPQWVLGTSFLLDRVVVFDRAMMHVGLTDYEPDDEIERILKESAEQGSEPDLLRDL